MAADGRAVFAWTYYNGDTVGTRDAVWGRRYASDGSPSGPEFAVNLGPGGQSGSDVAAAGDGSFVIVWVQTGSRADGVYFQRYTSSGEGLGGVVRLTAGSVASPSIGMTPDGRFVIVWQGKDDTGEGVFAQRFLADATPHGRNLWLSEGCPGSQLTPSVAVRTNGDFVVSWTSGFEKQLRWIGWDSPDRDFPFAPGPWVADFEPTRLSPTNGSLGAFTVAFDRAMDSSTFATNDVTMLCPMGATLRPAFVLPVGGGGGWAFDVVFADQLARGPYLVTIGPAVCDPLGLPMNEDGDMTNGEASADAFTSVVTYDSTAWSPEPTNAPYFLETFEAWQTAPPTYWSFTSESGRIIATSNDSPHAGAYHLKFDSTDGHPGPTAILKLDLSTQAGATNLALDFWLAGGSSGFNWFGVDISGDGQAWTVVRDGLVPGATYVRYAFDLDQILANAAIALDGDVYIRFRHEINGANSSYDMWLDDVRVSALDVLGARITSQTPSGMVAGPVSNLLVTFDEAMSPASFTAADVTVTGPVGNGVAVAAVTDTGDQRTFRIDLANPQGMPGTYTLSVGPDVLDVAGNPMNQNGDAVQRDGYSGTFRIAGVPATLPFAENFEVGRIDGLRPCWGFASSGSGVTAVTNTDGPHGGNYHLKMGASAWTVGYQSEADLALDLSGEAGNTNLVLAFWYRCWGHFGGPLCLRLDVSGDGISWTSPTNYPLPEYPTNVQVVADLDLLLTNAHIQADNDVHVRFYHQDASYYSWDRSAIDDVRVFDSARDRYVLQIASAHGGAIPEQGTTTNDFGSVIPCQVTNSPLHEGVLATQYICAGWAGTGCLASGTGTATTVFLTGNGTITWLWQTNYWLGAAASGYGTIDAGDGWLPSGCSTTVTATASPHHHLVSWGGDTNGCDISGDRITVPMDRPRRIAAAFAVDHCLLTVESAHGGVHVTNAPYFRMPITFSGYDRSEPLTNFPALVILGPDIPGFTYAGFASTNGADLRFCDTTGLTELNYEIEKWNTNGASFIWVQVPVLEGRTTRVWAYWGDLTLTNPPACATNGATWANGYMGVWHLGDGTALNARDSSPYRKDGVVSGATVATGKVDGAASFDGNDAVAVGNMGSLPQKGAFEFWMKPDVVENYRNPMTTKYNGGNAGMRWEEAANGSFGIVVGNDSGTWDGTTYLASGLNASSWYSVVYAWDTASNRERAFLNGSNAADQAHTLWPSTIPDLRFGTGYSTTGSRQWVGRLDEVRLSRVARSSNWLYACWYSMASNGAFTSYEPPTMSGIAEGGAYPYGALVTATVTNSPVPDGVGTQYVCAGASVAGNAFTQVGSNTVTLTLTNDATLVWHWVTNYWLEAIAIGEGEVVPGSGWRPAGAGATNTAVPDRYYHFVLWTGAVESAANPLVLTMDRAHVLFAHFAANLTTNGVPEWWLARYGWTNAFGAAAMADPDGDRHLTWQEYYADTVPTNDDSVLRIVSLSGSNAMLVTWQGGTSVWQYLERGTNLHGGAGQWQAIFTNRPPTPAWTNLLDTSATNLMGGGARNPPVFYRLRVVRP
jgi:hypothetical protein